MMIGGWGVLGGAWGCLVGAGRRIEGRIVRWRSSMAVGL